MERNHFSKRSLAVVAVLSNLVVAVVLALCLSGDAQQVFLPLVALTLPLLTAAAFDAGASRTKGAPKFEQPSHRDMSEPNELFSHAA